jgi:arylsulfatase A-like enzyme
MLRRAGRWLLLAALATGACAAPEAPSPPRRILLLTLDTTRADRIGAYGYEAAQTPTLDALARQGILFEQAFAATPITLPSHVSILTGVYPSAHGVHDNGIFRLRDDATLISEVLRKHGWRTGAFTGAYVVDAKFGLDQGFETYASTRRGGDAHDSRPASQVVRDAIDWLGGLDPDDRFFAWVHFFDPHSPYDPHGVETDSLEVAYDAEIAYCDRELARLLGFLKEAGLADDLLIAVTGDHGEAFGSHGENTHGVLLYQPTLHVPLLLSGEPVAHRAGERVPHPVSHVQLAATLLDLAGLPREAMPASRLPSLLASGDPPAPQLETLLPFYSYGWRGLLGLVDGSHKLIRGTEPELYALDEDPGETSDLSDREPELLRRMQARLDASLAEASPLGWAEALSPEASDAALLAKLGYVASPQAAGDPFDPALPDPRQRIGNVALSQKAIELFEEQQRLVSQPPPATAWQRDEREQESRRLLLEARDLLREILEEDPDIADVERIYGQVERELGDLETSIAWLERSVEQEPYRALSHYALGLSYWKAGRRDEARARVLQALRLSPKHPSFYEAMVAWAVEEEAFGRAYGWLEAWEKVADPDTPEASRVHGGLQSVGAEMRARGQQPVPAPLPVPGDGAG